MIQMYCISWGQNKEFQGYAYFANMATLSEPILLFFRSLLDHYFQAVCCPYSQCVLCNVFRAVQYNLLYCSLLLQTSKNKGLQKIANVFLHDDVVLDSQHALRPRNVMSCDIDGSETGVGNTLFSTRAAQNNNYFRHQCNMLVHCTVTTKVSVMFMLYSYYKPI